MATDSDQNIRVNSDFRQFPNDIWSNRKAVFLNITRDSNNTNNKLRYGFLITHDDLVYVVGDNSGELLGVSENQMNSIGSYQLNLRLSYLKVEDIQVGTRIAAARTATGKLIVWGPGLHGIVEPELSQDCNYGSTAIIHHYCGSDYVMAVTSKGDVVYCKPRSGSATSRYQQHKFIKLWPDINLPAFRWCGGTHGAAFALTTGGKLYSWGRNKHAELGRCTVTKAEEAVGPLRNYKLEKLPHMVEIPLGFAVEKVACGIYHAAALTGCGKLYLWGTNISGVLGDGSESAKHILPQLVSLRLPVKTFVTSKIRPVVACQLSNGMVYAWGALNRRLMVSTPVPVRTHFFDITSASIHFDMEFQKSWEVKRDVYGSEQTRNMCESQGDKFMQSMLSTPSVSTFIPSTPAYGSSTPLNTPSTPIYVPSTPLYAPSTPLYEPSTPLYEPSTPIYAPPTPVHAPPTPLYSQDFDVLDYNHGNDPGTPLYDEPIRSPPRRSQSQTRAIKATFAAQPPPPPEPCPVSRSPPPPPPSRHPVTPQAQQNQKTLDQYHELMNLLNISSAGATNSPKKRPSEAATTTTSTSGTSIRAPASATTFEALVPFMTPKPAAQPSVNPWILPSPPPVKMPRLSAPTTTEAFSFKSNSSHNSNRESTRWKSSNATPCSIKEHIKTFSVSSSAASAVIGSGGCNINYIRKRTGATIKVLGTKRSGHQLVQITGRTPEIVQKAYKEIEEIILPYQGRKW